MADNIFKISTPSLTVDNVVLPIVPNSLNFTEGFGEQQVKTQSSGGGSVQMVISRNVETAYTKVTCQVENTQANIEFLRRVKSNFNFHVVTFFDSLTGFTRTVQQALLTSDYEVGLGADTPITVEFMGSASV